MNKPLNVLVANYLIIELYRQKSRQLELWLLTWRLVLEKIVNIILKKRENNNSHSGLNLFDIIQVELNKKVTGIKRQ